jgi:hypothetical protein
VISWVLLGILAPALYHKVTAWPRFVAVLRAYELVPSALVPVAAVGLALLELAAAVLLVFLQPAGLWLAAGLFALYLVAMTINLLRGRVSIDCGCGDEPTLISAGLVLRNAVLVLFAFTGLRTGSPDSIYELVVCAGLAFAVVVVYLSIDQLFANSSRHQRLWRVAEPG